jgi:hypothetical protein
MAQHLPFRCTHSPRGRIIRSTRIVGTAKGHLGPFTVIASLNSAAP